MVSVQYLGNEGFNIKWLWLILLFSSLSWACWFLVGCWLMARLHKRPFRQKDWVSFLNSCLATAAILSVMSRWETLVSRDVIDYIDHTFYAECCLGFYAPVLLLPLLHAGFYWFKRVRRPTIYAKKEGDFCKHVLAHCPSLSRVYRPTWWAIEGHIITGSRFAMQKPPAGLTYKK